MPRLRVTGLTLVLAAAAFSPPAALAAPKVLKAGQMALSLEWNPTWQIGEVGPQGPPNSAQFNTANPQDMLVMVMAKSKPADADADKTMRSIMESAARELAPQSVEKEIKVEPFGSGGTRGYRICLTDRAPKPGEYKFMCEGMANNGSLVVQFTVLYNDAGRADALEAVKAFESVQAAPGT
jgi:hypothetical protein